MVDGMVDVVVLEDGIGRWMYREEATSLRVI